jgi:hemoglobin-like flavoprotein
VIDFEKVFNESYKRILGGSTSRENDFFDAFYEAFIDSSPLVAEKFRGVNMASQKIMLKQSLIHLLNMFGTKRIPPVMKEIAEKHSRRGADIPPELYQTWLECLIATVKRFDPRFNDDVELAWRMICSQGIAFMTFMHKR